MKKEEYDEEEEEEEEEATFDLNLLVTQLASLAMKEEEDIEAIMNKQPKKYIALLEAINVVLFKSCGNANKLGEVVTALKLRDSMPDCLVVHVKNAYKADIKLIHRETGEVRDVECKDSYTRKPNAYKSNWNFVVSRAAIRHGDAGGAAAVPTEVDIREYIAQCYMKMQGGYAIMKASCATGELNMYVMDGNFMAIVLCKMALNQTGKPHVTINLGGRRCDKCLHYHRIAHLQTYEALFRVYRERIGSDEPIYTFECFTADEWAGLPRTASHCLYDV